MLRGFAAPPSTDFSSRYWLDLCRCAPMALRDTHLEPSLGALRLCPEDSMPPKSMLCFERRLLATRTNRLWTGPPMHSNLSVASPVPKSTPTWSTTMGSLAIVGRFHLLLPAVYLVSPIFIDETTAAAASEVVRGGTAHSAGQRRGPTMCPGLVIPSPSGCCHHSIHGVCCSQFWIL